MFEDESIGKKEGTTCNWKRFILLAVPVVVIIIVILVLQPWNNGYESDITRAYAAMSEVESCRCSVISTYDGYRGVGVQPGMEGEYVSPNRYYMKMTDDGQVSEFIIIGDVQYFTSSGVAGPIEIGRTALVFGYTRLLENILSEERLSYYLDMIVDVQELPIEEIDGVNCIHYLGQWNVEKQIEETRQSVIEDLTSVGTEVDEEEIDRQLEYMRSATMSIEYWIGTDEHLIRQMRTRVQYQDDSDDFPSGSMSMTMTFYDFNEPITIEAPVNTDGQLLPGWQMDTLPGVE